MCGIAGRFNYDAMRPVDRATLEAMTDSMSHRGPDASGYHVAPGIGLGHRRLSIIDLSTGDQPLANETGTIWTVFNGEIYNFADVRAELIAHGHRFRTNSDTEIIVHGYEQWGERCVDKFRGMFAFAVWDSAARRLMLARDRVGVKPLYYAELPGRGLVFGSELKSLLEDPDVSREWRPDALDAFLTLLYIPAPATIYQGIHKLEPGHVLIAEKGAIRTSRYWDLEFTGDGDARRESDYLEELDALLRESVALRQIADVPLGAFLSGGIDSSAVAAYMVETSSRPPLTISVGFDDAAYDELAHAKLVAEHLGCEFHPRTVTPDIVDLLPKLAWHLDEPFADSSAVPTYYVSQAARELVTVALSGDGGDELWAGYARHRVERWELAARHWLGATGSRITGRIAERLPPAVKGARSLRHLALPPPAACAVKHGYGLFDSDARGGLYSPEFAHEVRDADPFIGFRLAYDACSSRDPLDCALYVDVKTYLVDDIMTKVDKMSMAVSLESREPLLDHKLLEFAARVPSSLKLKNGQGKYLLRRLLERRIPKAIVDRPKHGFEAPIGEWLRGPLAPMADALLGDGRLRDRGVFDDRAIGSLWAEHRAGKQDHRHRLWSLVMLELWFREFVDGNAAARPDHVPEVARQLQPSGEAA